TDSAQRGKLSVSVKGVGGSEDDGDEKRRGVVVEFQDTGPGIPMELREQVFNPFFTTKKTGVGLGLSIVSKILDDHGGRIYVANGAGTGACFRLFLPAAEEQASTEND